MVVHGLCGVGLHRGIYITKGRSLEQRTEEEVVTTTTGPKFYFLLCSFIYVFIIHVTICISACIYDVSDCIAGDSHSLCFEGEVKTLPRRPV